MRPERLRGVSYPALILWLLLAVSCNKSDTIVEGYVQPFQVQAQEVQELYFNAGKNGMQELGLYDADGEMIRSTVLELRTQQPTTSKPWEEGLGYAHKQQIEIPDIPPGVYFWQNAVPFVVKAKKARRIKVVLPYATMLAYSTSGGKSFYKSIKEGDSIRAVKLSTNRHVVKDRYSISFLQWIKNSGWANEVDYVTDLSLNDPTTLDSCALVILIGHSEYWSRSMRNNVDAFNAAGGRLLVLSGNTMWWQIRIEEDRLVCYKSDSDRIENRELATVQYNASRLNYSPIASVGMSFEHAGYGKRIDPPFHGYKVVQPSHPVFKGVDLTNNTLHIVSSELDGLPVLEGLKNGNPIPDTSGTHWQEFECLAWAHGFYLKPGFGFMIAFRKSEKHGRIINAGTTDFCSDQGIGGVDGHRIKKIADNMIHYLLQND